jgi:hypothetical protein
MAARFANFAKLFRLLYLFVCIYLLRTNLTNLSLVLRASMKSSAPLSLSRYKLIHLTA